MCMYFGYMDMQLCLVRARVNHNSWKKWLMRTWNRENQLQYGREMYSGYIIYLYVSMLFIYMLLWTASKPVSEYVHWNVSLNHLIVHCFNLKQSMSLLYLHNKRDLYELNSLPCLAKQHIFCSYLFQMPLWHMFR